MRDHVVLEHKYDGTHAIKLLEEPYSGIIISYGKVSFDTNDDDDVLKLSFDYEIHDDREIEYDKIEFENYLGDFLQELIIHGVENNDITYTGGVDSEN
jgi:hypothetical protein